MTWEPSPQKLKHIDSLVASTDGIVVGDLDRVDAKGIFFTYEKEWIANGYNLPPITMNFDNKPQLALLPMAMITG